MGFNEVLSSWSSSEEEDGHDLDEDRDQVLPKPFNTTIGFLEKNLQQTGKVSQYLFSVK